MHLWLLVLFTLGCVLQSSCRCVGCCRHIVRCHTLCQVPGGAGGQQDTYALIMEYLEVSGGFM